MADFFGKFKELLLGVDNEDEEYEEYDDEPVQTLKPIRGARTETTEITTLKPRRIDSLSSTSGVAYTNNVVDINSSKRTQILVCTPQNIEEARQVISNTKNSVISVVNLDGVEIDVAQRIADFLSGSVDALDGSIKRLSNEMFLIAPIGVNIMGEDAFDKELKSSGVSFSSVVSGSAR